MAESSGSLLQQHRSLHASLDPKSLILSQFSGSHQLQFLQLTTDSFIMERGPKYDEYSALRNKRLRMKSSSDQQTPEREKDEKVSNRSSLTPRRKLVKFNSNFTPPPKKPKSTSILTQSVPDFSSALRKENRKPRVALPPLAERCVTPPAGLLKSGKMYGKLGGGSKSTNSVEKTSGGIMARKSYASMEELKGLASAAGNAINGGGRVGRGIGKTVFKAQTVLNLGEIDSAFFNRLIR